MKYTSKDICKFFHFKRDTLRHYEQLGIIHPEINPDNHYRYYDEWDIYSIADCKKSQTLGMSLKTISHLQNNGSLSEFINHAEECQKSLKRQADYYALLSQKNEDYINRLKYISTDLGKCDIINIPEAYFFPSIINTTPFMDSASLDLGHFAFNNHAFFDSSFLISVSDYHKNCGNITWGLAIQKYYADKINAPTGHTKKMPAGKAVHSLINAGERRNFTYQLLKPIMDFIVKNGHSPLENIYGLLLARAYNEGRYCRYFEIYIPII